MKSVAHFVLTGIKAALASVAVALAAVIEITLRRGK